MIIQRAIRFHNQQVFSITTSWTLTGISLVLNTISSARRYAKERISTMRKATIIAVIILLQISLCVDTGSSADKPKRNSQKQTITIKETPATSVSKPPPTYLSVAFDMNTERIPIPYLGHDIEQVYNAFDRRKKAERKDEFETTDQYQKRLSGQSSEPLFGSVGPDAILAFVVSPSSQFDADSQTLTVSLGTSPVWQSVQIDRSRLGVRIKRGETTKQKSIGQNAYGAKVEIEETHAKGFELAIHNQRSFEKETVLSEYEKESQRRMAEMRAKYNLPAISLDMGGETVFVQRINMGPTEAKAAKDKIAALILAKPITPNISYGAILRKATFKDPTEFFHQMYYVDVDLLEIWIYDKLTGELITKIKSR